MLYSGTNLDEIDMARADVVAASHRLRDQGQFTCAFEARLFPILCRHSLLFRRQNP